MPSSVIAAISYDTHKQMLEVRFLSGAMYKYFQVPEEVFLAFERARSKGSYFNRFIKERYVFRQIA